MLPPFTTDGTLPQGVHVADWGEVSDRFGTNDHRRSLLQGLGNAIEQLRLAGCRRVYLDGSFVTSAPVPGDYDVCYEIIGVDPSFLDPVFLDFRAGRAAQKAKYGGELFPCAATASPGYNFLQFFQVDKANGQPKGIVALNLKVSP